MKSCGFPDHTIARDQERETRPKRLEANALQSLAYQMVSAIPRWHVAYDFRKRANPEQVLRPGIGYLGFPLHHDPNGLSGPDGSLDRHDRFGAANGNRHSRARKQDHAPDRENDQFIILQLSGRLQCFRRLFLSRRRRRLMMFFG